MKNQKGFTLIEVLIAIVIIAIIIGIIAAMTTSGLRQTGEQTEKMAKVNAFTKEFGINLNEHVRTPEAPLGAWLTPEQKSIVRPVVQTKLNSLVPQAIRAKREALIQERERLLARPPAITPKEADSRLGALSALNSDIEDCTRILSANEQELRRVRDLAALFDVLPLN